MGKQNYLEHKELQKKISKLEKLIKQTEISIEENENRISEIDNLFFKPENASNLDLVNEYSSIKDKINNLVSDWEKLNEELDNIKN